MATERRADGGTAADPLDAFVRGMPKAELHMHLEGSLEPELVFELAARNGVPLRWTSPDELRRAFDFAGLQPFLDLFYECCQVLVTEQDFYDATRAYLRRAVADGVVRAECFIGPQSFTTRGVPIAAVLDGVLAALREAEREDAISAGLIVSAHRHRTEADAFALLREIEPWADRILGIGMGGAERGNPPAKFARFFRACRDAGLRLCIHAGEEGPADYVREAVELLGVDRIDHGIACLDDPGLVRSLAAVGTPLTVCPLSNVHLKVVPSLARHPLKGMLDAGLHATVNSDDPPYFGGYVTENLLASQRALALSGAEVAILVRNGLTAAFWPEPERHRAVSRLDAYLTRRSSVGASG